MARFESVGVWESLELEVEVWVSCGFQELFLCAGNGLPSFVTSLVCGQFDLSSVNLGFGYLVCVSGLVVGLAGLRCVCVWCEIV